MSRRTAAMTRTEFRRYLRELGLSPYKAAKHLGVSIRQCHRYASGETPVPGPVAMVLRAMVKNVV